VQSEKLRTFFQDCKTASCFDVIAGRKADRIRSFLTTCRPAQPAGLPVRNDRRAISATFGGFEDLLIERRRGLCESSPAEFEEETMQPRINPYKTAPDLMSAMTKLENAVRDSGLEKPLAELVKTRASQINGCAFCLHMHTRDARAAGETEERLYLLDAWRESSLYTPRERAALAWTESVTLVAQTHVPDSAFDDVSAQFDKEELVKLTLLITTINAWNRIAIAFRIPHPPGASASKTTAA
jgi:AhpD family alkylhydroperoxidase